MGSGFDVFKSISVGYGLDGGDFGEVSLIQPEMKVTLARNNPGVGAVIDDGEIINRKFDGNTGSGNDLSGSRRDERN